MQGGAVGGGDLIHARALIAEDECGLGHIPDAYGF